MTTGGVTRGVCEVGEDEILRAVREAYNIIKTADGLTASDKEGNPVTVRGRPARIDEYVGD